MALITLNDLYDKWKKVADWVTGVDTVSAPIVRSRAEGLTTFDNGSVTITSSAVALKVSGTAMVGRKQMVVYPPSAGTIYWGTSTVTTANGAPLAAGNAPVVFDLDPGTAVAIYAVSDGTDRTVRVVELK